MGPSSRMRCHIHSVFGGLGVLGVASARGRSEACECGWMDGWLSGWLSGGSVSEGKASMKLLAPQADRQAGGQAGGSTRLVEGVRVEEADEQEGRVAHRDEHKVAVDARQRQSHAED